METITSSYNLFVDSSRSHTTASTGDDFQINLQDAGVHAGDGEFIRLNLENFSMAKNFSDVNTNNSHIRVRGNSGSSFWTTSATGNPSYVDVRLTYRNNKSVYDLASDFSSKIILALNSLQTLGTVSLKANTTSPTSATANTDNIIQFTVSYTGTRLTSNAEVYIQLFAEESDSYELLGGDRINGASVFNSTQKSITSSVNTAANEITFTCLYPAQRSTTPFIYLRAPGVLNTNIETKGLKNHSDDHKSDTAYSDILGRVVVESSEWIQYTAQTGREFFLDIHQKSLNFLRLKLTDSHNRPIARKKDTVSKTATGSGTQQSTLGNLNFSAVIRFDIVKRRTVQHLETEHYQPNVPARFSTGVVTHLRNGEDTFGKSPGY